MTGDARTFLTRVWASHVLIHHADPERLTAFLSIEDADRLLTESGIRTPAIRVAKDGSVLPEAAVLQHATMAGKLVTGLVDTRKALSLYDDGATIVFQGLHRYWPPLTSLIARLETELGHPCQANAYLTPPGAQGFALHADSHDVFVFQTSGTKRWEIHADGGAQDVLLEPGVCVYLPTGTKHAARTEESASLHVTIGINQLTMRALVRRAIAEAVAAVSDDHLPAGFLDDPEALTAALATRLAELAGRVADIDASAAVRAEQDRVLTSRPSRLSGGLLDRVGLARLTDVTELVRRPGSPCVLREGPGDGRLTVLLGDRTLEAPAWLRPALEVLARRETLVPADLADLLDAQSRLVLCRRLIREGLLRISP